MAKWWRILTRPRGGPATRLQPASPASHPPDRQQPERHLPGAAPIEAYGDGGFRFAGMSHRGAILLMPNGIFAFAATTPAELTVDAFARVFAGPKGLAGGPEKGLETFLIGTGPTFAPLLPEIVTAFRTAGIVVEAMTTGSAVSAYNIMLDEGRAVGAALLPVGAAK